MDCSSQALNSDIRKIEDIIEIQRAKGNFNVRQVAFTLPSETDSTASTNLTKSLESGLSKEKCKVVVKKAKKISSKRSKSPLHDVVSWPSDSDITVLRMKLGMSNKEQKDKLGNVVVPGDGLHQPDSSSMINLATLILQSQSTSKHSMNVEEYLLPLTSWEHCKSQDKNLSDDDRGKPFETRSVVIDEERKEIEPCSGQDDNETCFGSLDSDYSKNTKKSKMAKFLRLYFCPCCTCLYRLEKMQEEPSACFTKHNEALKVF